MQNPSVNAYSEFVTATNQETDKLFQQTSLALLQQILQILQSGNFGSGSSNTTLAEGVFNSNVF